MFLENWKNKFNLAMNQYNNSFDQSFIFPLIYKIKFNSKFYLKSVKFFDIEELIQLFPFDLVDLLEARILCISEYLNDLSVFDEKQFNEMKLLFLLLFFKRIKIDEKEKEILINNVYQSFSHKEKTQ